MTNHPYPQKIVDEIADYLKPYTASRIEAGSLAHQVLRRVWKASQVDTLEQLDELPNDAVLIDGNRVVADDYVTHCIIDLPAHVLHWGDSDE